jgi:hypothetical protein
LPFSFQTSLPHVAKGHSGNQGEEKQQKIVVKEGKKIAFIDKSLSLQLNFKLPLN